MMATLMACAVCFGDSDSDMARGARLSVLFLLALTYLVIGGGLAAFFYARSRARAGRSGSANA